MPDASVSGPTIAFPIPSCFLPYAKSRDVWQRWRSLHDAILHYVSACDRLGVDLTIDQLAEELDEALGLVERRAEELQSLQLIRLGSDRRVELEHAARSMCG